MICYVPNDRLPETNNNRPSSGVVTVKGKKRGEYYKNQCKKKEKENIQ